MKITDDIERLFIQDEVEQLHENHNNAYVDLTNRPTMTFMGMAVPADLHKFLASKPVVTDIRTTYAGNGTLSFQYEQKPYHGARFIIKANNRKVERTSEWYESLTDCHNAFTLVSRMLGYKHESIDNLLKSAKYIEPQPIVK